MNVSESSQAAGPSRGSVEIRFEIPEDLQEKSAEDLFTLAKANIRAVLLERRISGRVVEDLAWIDEILDILGPVNEYYNPQASLRTYLNRQANSTSFDPQIRMALYAVWLGIQKMKERGDTIYAMSRKVREIKELLTPTVFNRRGSRSVWEARRSRKSRKSTRVTKGGGKTRRSKRS
jgi:hypothetical protein